MLVNKGLGGALIFGYLKPFNNELKGKHSSEYKKYYCALCYGLRTHLGFFSSMLLNYECTFLYVFLSGVSPEGPSQECTFRCSANPAKKISTETSGDVLEYASFVNYHLAVLKAYEEAYKWFNSSAAWHYGPGLTALGDCFFYGRGVQKDREKGLKYYAKAYEHSDSEGAYRLACWYEGIQSNAQNLNKAAQYFEKAAEWGCVPACYKIGKCYELGRGVKYDLHRAFNWYMRGADQNYIPAIMQVASYYQTGKYVPEDRKKWQEWVERAAKLGDSSAQYKLAEHYEHEGSIYLAEVLDKPDREIEPALAEAIRLYKQSAAQGYSMAKNGLESLRKSLQSEAEKGNNSRYSVMALRLLKLF